MKMEEHLYAAMVWLEQAEENFDAGSREANYERIMIANVHAEIAQTKIMAEELKL